MNQITDPGHLLPPPAKTPDKPAPPPPAGRGRTLLMAAAAVLVLGLVGWGTWQHVAASNRAHQAQQAAQDATPSVRVATAKADSGPVKLVLPGTTSAFDSARLYARATGYIGKRLVDIGDRVKSGDLLLKIDAPDTDAQLAQAAAQLGQTKAALVQAQANLDSARSNVDLAKVTNQRTSTLASQGWETRQNADNTKANVSAGSAGVDAAQAGITVAQANIAAQAATVQRLQALVGFEQVTAPIDGVITARTVDTGDLVSADAGGGTALLAIQNDNVLRAEVYVPQSDAIPIRPGLAASVRVPELPGQTFPGMVARSSVSLDPVSRTVLTEVDVPNADHRLRAGLYVEVTIEVPRSSPGIVIPDEAIILGADGPRVAVVQDGRAKLLKIDILRDFGTSAELRSGLNGGEQIVLAAPTGLADGTKVTVQPPDKKEDAPGQAPKAGTT